MLTPTIDFGEISITLPCALKDIGGVTVDEEETFEYNYEGIDALNVSIYLNGSLIDGVTLDNRDKDIPIEEKPIIEFPVDDEAEFHGIRCYHSKWKDACEIAGRPDCVKRGNFFASLENGYYLECLASATGDGSIGETVEEITVYTLFESAEEVKRALQNTGHN